MKLQDRPWNQPDRKVKYAAGSIPLVVVVTYLAHQYLDFPPEVAAAAGSMAATLAAYLFRSAA